MLNTGYPKNRILDIRNCMQRFGVKMIYPKVGNGSCRPWVVSAVSHFGPASFRLELFRPWVVRPNLVGRFGLIF